MIIKNGKNLLAVYYGNKPILYIYKGTTLLWSSISSSFGGGVWNNDSVWSNDDIWVNS